MTYITADNIGLDYPIFGTHSHSFRHHLLNVSTGGLLKFETKTVVIRALNEISFDLKPGDRLALIGHNGAGKSTLLRVLAGIYDASFGTLKSQGKIGALLDLGLGMEREATGYENIKIRGLLLGLNHKEIERMTRDVEDFIEMGDFLRMPVKTYSAGMAIRLSFAISTSTTPDILLIDEALGAGDAAFMAKAEARLKTFLHQSDILVLASHDFEVIRKFCNKALWLEHGNMRGLGDVDQIIENYQRAVHVTAPQSVISINNE